MEKIVSCCFSVNFISSDLDKYKSELSKALQCIEISQTLKIHVLLHHLNHSLNFLNGDESGISRRIYSSRVLKELE